MSRVHDALRKAAHEKPEAAKPATRRFVLPAEPAEDLTPTIADDSVPNRASNPVANLSPGPVPNEVGRPARAVINQADLENLEDMILGAREVPFNPAADALIINPAKPKDPPSEEFRSLRTRLNHLQTTQPLHTLVISSASPGEGKSFTACNLAMSQAQLAGKRVLLADFDFRRPSIQRVFGISDTPGITDYLLGKASFSEILYRIADTNLYVMTAGETVPNPLELLNLKECNALIENLRDHFDWVILDSPPLLFAADGNLLATMCDGTILVVRIGSTTFDSVSRAMQSLCENNVLGTVVNGARRGELYSKYSYYHNYYYATDQRPDEASEEVLEAEPVAVRAED